MAIKRSRGKDTTHESVQTGSHLESNAACYTERRLCQQRRQRQQHTEHLGQVGYL